jgi:hypothetical protein
VTGPERRTFGRPGCRTDRCWPSGWPPSTSRRWRNMAAARLQGRPGRCQRAAECGPYDLSGVCECGVAPGVAEGADEVQPTAGLGEQAGRLGHGYGITIAMSPLRSAAPHCCTVAKVKWRAALIDLAPVPRGRVAIRGGRPHRAAGSDGDHWSRPARPARPAAAISHSQPASLSAGATRAAGSPWRRSPVLITATAPSSLARCHAERGELGRGKCRLT